MAVVTKGILGRKLGMTQIFDDAARAIPVTAIEAGPCRIAQIRTPERDGYSAIQLAFGEIREQKLTKPKLGHLQKSGTGPSRHLVELRVADAAKWEIGQELKADVFVVGEKADVIGTSKGKGFAGVMKRHGFHGKPASHGTERKHRSPGSIGAGTTPHHVFKGQKMAGRMGHERVTILNLEVVRVDAERNLILVRGAVPGPDGGLVIVRSSVRSPSPMPERPAEPEPEAVADEEPSVATPAPEAESAAPEDEIAAPEASAETAPESQAAPEASPDAQYVSESAPEAAPAGEPPKTETSEEGSG
jgi:large subunit ribosomal protein L3